MISININSPFEWTLGIVTYNGIDDEENEYRIIELGFIIFSIMIVY